MNMKKVLAFLLAAVLIMGCITGCQPENTTTKTTEADKTTDGEPAQSTDAEPTTEAVYVPQYPLVKEGEEVTIKGVLFSSEKDPDNTERIVYQKWEEISGVNIEFEIVDTAAMNTYLASGDWPDFLMFKFSDTIVYDYGVIGGRFVNLLDYIDIMPNLAKTFDEYPSTKNGFVQSNGEMYEFPMLNIAVTSVVPRQYWRTDVLEEHGLKVPTTVDEFKNVLATLKEKTGSIQWIPKVGKSYIKNTWMPGIFCAFGEYVDMVFAAEDDNSVTFVPTTDQMKHYYEYMNELYEEELIHQELFSIDDKLAQSLELDNKMLVLDHAGSKITAEMMKDNKWSYLSVCPPLTSEYDSTKTLCNGVTASRSTQAPFLNAESEHVELMCKLFDMMYATEEVVEGTGFSGMSFGYGIEGVHWYINEDGKSYEQVVPSDYEGNWGTFKGDKLIFYGMGRSTELGMMVTSTPGNAQARQTAFVEHVWPYVSENEAFPKDLLRFTEDEQYVIQQKWSEIETYVYEMQAKFISGIVDIETGWDDYVKTLDKMGLQDVLKVFQAAYDRWCSY